MENFTLGADPEFSIPNVTAARIVSNSYSARFGADGGAFEVRPRPSTEPKGIIEGIQASLLEGYNRYPEIRLKPWLAGSYPAGRPLGGHIHFGLSLQSSYIRALDLLLAYPLGLIEHPEKARRRLSRYGQEGSIRDQNWGFEYRVPASWLVSKGIALAALSLAKAVMFEAVNHEPRLNGQLKHIKVKTHLAMIEYRQGYQNWKRIIVKLALFKSYTSEISLFFWMIENKKRWREEKDIKESWLKGMIQTRPAADIRPMPAGQWWETN